MADGGAKDEYDYLINLILIGDEGVGKSNLLYRYTRNDFNFQYETLKCVNSVTDYNDFKKLKIVAHDIAGSLRHCTNIVTDYYRGATYALLVYDVTRRSSFENAKEWLRELREQAQPNVKIVLVGNKIDLETSALCSMNVTAAFGAAFQYTQIITPTIATNGRSGGPIQKGNTQFDPFFKVIFVGDENVGKTNLFSRAGRNMFNLNYLAVKRVCSIVEYDHVNNTKFEFHVISSTLRHCKNIINDYYREAMGVLLVYDVTRRSSFENAKGLLSELKDINPDPNLLVMLVGNKTDLSNSIKVSTEEGKSFAMSKSIRFIETSALNTNNVRAATQNVISELLRRITSATKTSENDFDIKSASDVPSKGELGSNEKNSEKDNHQNPTTTASANTSKVLGFAAIDSGKIKMDHVNNKLYYAPKTQINVYFGSASDPKKAAEVVDELINNKNMS